MCWEIGTYFTMYVLGLCFQHVEINYTSCVHTEYQEPCVSKKIQVSMEHNENDQCGVATQRKQVCSSSIQLSYKRCQIICTTHHHGSTQNTPITYLLQHESTNLENP